MHYNQLFKAPIKHEDQRIHIRLPVSFDYKYTCMYAFTLFHRLCFPTSRPNYKCFHFWNVSGRHCDVHLCSRV